ncbi:MAG: hypothetical protein ACLFU1_08025 [Alphaproteobacteria bacterium]
MVGLDEIAKINPITAVRTASFGTEFNRGILRSGNSEHFSKALGASCRARLQGKINEIVSDPGTPADPEILEFLVLSCPEVFYSYLDRCARNDAPGTVAELEKIVRRYGENVILDPADGVRLEFGKKLAEIREHYLDASEPDFDGLGIS